MFVIAYRGNNAIEKTTYEVKLGRLPVSFDGFCVVQISDLHDQRFGPWQPRLLQYVRESHPDIIVVTGDVTRDGDYRAPDLRNLAGQLVSIAPTYFVTGNHERHLAKMPGLLSDLETAGVKVLRNETAAVTRGGQQIQVVGIDDPMLFLQEALSFRAGFQLWKDELTRLRSAVPADRFTILLSHRPEFLRLYSRLGFDVVFTGHAHGGQIRIPGIGALYAPEQGKFPKYTDGVKYMDQTTEVISRGLGGSWFPVRVFNRPEVVVVKLTRTPQ